MGEIAFAGGKVGESVSIKISGSQGVGLGEFHSTDARFVFFGKDDVFLESDFTLGGGVFEPGKSPGMGGQTAHDVIVSVAIDVKDEHLGSSRLGEMVRMELPVARSERVFGSFIPSFLF